jgi:transposase
MAKMPIAVLGIDLGKNSCSVAGLHVNGAVVLRRRMTREGFGGICQQAADLHRGDGSVLRRALPGSDVCLARPDRLISPEYVRPYVKSLTWLF